MRGRSTPAASSMPSICSSVFSASSVADSNGSRSSLRHLEPIPVGRKTSASDSNMSWTTCRWLSWTPLATSTCVPSESLSPTSTPRTVSQEQFGERQGALFLEVDRGEVRQNLPTRNHLVAPRGVAQNPSSCTYSYQRIRNGTANRVQCFCHVIRSQTLTPIGTTHMEMNCPRAGGNALLRRGCKFIRCNRDRRVFDASTASIQRCFYKHR